MNKYKEALNDMCNGCYGVDGCNGKDKYCSRYLTLKELVDKETLDIIEEIKKEWEELGYEWKIKNEDPYIIHLIFDDPKPEFTFTIKINTRNKTYWKIWGNEEYEPIMFEEHQLLTKTFKALGWRDKDE